MDLISRQAVIKAIEDLQDCYNGFSDTYDKACIIGVIEEVPSVEPVKHGRWINVKISISGNSSAECTLCGAVVHNNFSNVINYCPKCGAKMDLDEVKE